MYITMAYKVQDFIKNLCAYLINSDEINCTLIYPKGNATDFIEDEACIKHTIRGNDYFIHFRREPNDFAGIQ